MAELNENAKIINLLLNGKFKNRIADEKIQVDGKTYTIEEIIKIIFDHMDDLNNFIARLRKTFNINDDDIFEEEIIEIIEEEEEDK